MNKEIKLKIKGIKGEDGKSPVYKVDFFTDAEQKEFVDKIIAEIPKPKNGTNGKDGGTPIVDYKKIENIIKDKIKDIELPIAEKVTMLIPKVEIPTVENIIIEVKNIIENSKYVSEKDIEKLREELFFYVARNRVIGGGGGITTVESITPVNPNKLIGRGDSGAGNAQEISLGVGLTLTGTVLSSTGGGGGSTWGAITGTLSDQTDLQSILNTLVPYSGAVDNVYLAPYSLFAEGLNTSTLPVHVGQSLDTNTSDIEVVRFGTTASGSSKRLLWSLTDNALLFTDEAFTLINISASTITASGALSGQSVNVSGGVYATGGFFGSSIFINDGAAAAPAISFQSDTNTGFYRVSSDILGLATNGVQRVRFTTVDVVSSVPVRGPLNPYGGSWSGSTRLATEGDVYGKIETISASAVSVSNTAPTTYVSIPQEFSAYLSNFYEITLVNTLEIGLGAFFEIG
jgi:hypothetical protein